MKPGQSKLPAIVMGIAGGVVAVWLGMAVAPGASGGLSGIFAALTNAIDEPLRLRMVTETPRCVLVLRHELSPGRGIRQRQVGQSPLH